VAKKPVSAPGLIERVAAGIEAMSAEISHALGVDKKWVLAEIVFQATRLSRTTQDAREPNRDSR
jgi:hypothetical protein